ncbi:hypothetical protein [Halorussus marinus]|uniref:hypothetical protein n=1 Tax=Halorussus marinus TaxID=2505976 RepID=UPI00106EE52D|nr:hypothetical protein [Halorussus marinus]
MGSGDPGRSSVESVMENHRSLNSIVPGGDGEPDTLRERVSHWVLLEGRRESVTAGLLLGVLTGLIVLSMIRPVDMYSLLQDTNTAQTLFNTLLSGTILLVSVVVSVTSIVLSEEITDIESQRQRIDGSIDYRGEIEEFIESDVSPARPADFLRTILRIIDQQASTIADIAADGESEEFAEDARTFADEVTAEAERAGEILSGARFGSFKVLLAGLNYDYSWQLHVARRFDRTYGEELTDDQQAAIDDLVESLKIYATGREYFKSLYYKREFARLSSRLLYVSLPTIVVTSYVLLALDSNLFPEVTFLTLTPLAVFVTVAYTIALTPYVMLTAFVLRAMTVTLRTLASGPFVLERGSELDEFDWDESDIEVSDRELQTGDGKQRADD